MFFFSPPVTVFLFKGTPNIQRTAVCAELLWNLSKKFGRFSDLHALLVFEMMSSIYHRFDIDSDSDMHRNDSSNWNVSDFLNRTPYYELIDGLQATVRKLRSSLRKLTTLRDEVEEEAIKRNKVFSMSIKSWQDQLLRRMFQNWNQGTMMQKRMRQLLRLRRLRIWFNAFKKRWERSKLDRMKILYEETEEERDRQEKRADGLLIDKTQLEHDVKGLNKHIGTLETEIMNRDAVVEDLRRQLAESKDRETRLTDSCERMLTLQLNQTELQIGKVPGMEMSTAFGSNEEDEKKEAPFWTSLQDMSQLSRSALEQLEIESNGSSGAVKKMEYGSMKLWEAGEYALEKLLDNPSSLIKCWVNELLRDGSACEDVDVNDNASDVMMELREMSQTGRLRINNFSSHLKDSQEYATLLDKLLKAQLPEEFQGTYELVLTTEQLQFDLEAKKIKEKKEKQLALAELKKEEARNSKDGILSRPGTAPIEGNEEKNENEETNENENENDKDEKEEGSNKDDVDNDNIENETMKDEEPIIPSPPPIPPEDGELFITRDTMQRVVMSQFDSGARAVRLLACAQEWLSVTEEMIAPNEIEDGDSEWNVS